MRTRLLSYSLLLALVSNLFCYGVEAASNSRGYPVDILKETFAYTQDDVDVALETIFQGCAGRDCIPSVDNPEYILVASVDYLEDTDLLISLSYLGQVRAYPTRFLDQHEIVNDDFLGEPVAVTYCPLCGSGLAFLSTLDGQRVEFGVSGLLHNNDLIMYDRTGHSLWQQITGTAIAGPKRGSSLQALPVTMTEWSEWKKAHPEGRVLAPPNPSRTYKAKVYGDYEESKRLMFPVALQDARLHRKKVVYGIKAGEQAVAVDAEWLMTQGSWSHELEEGLLKLELAADGGVNATINGLPIAAHRMFWFAWYSFNPATAFIGAQIDK